MDRVRCIGLLCVAALLQVTWGAELALWGVKPDLLVVAALACGFYFEFPWACVCALSAGALKDIFGVSLWGMYAVSYALLAWAMVYVRGKFELDAPLVRTSVVAVTVMAYDIVLALAGAGARESISWGVTLRLIFLETAWAVFLVQPVSWAMAHLVRPRLRVSDIDDAPELLEEP